MVEVALQEPVVGDSMADALVGDNEGEGASLQEAVKLLIDPGG